MHSALVYAMVQDPLVGHYPGQHLVDRVEITNEDFLLSGPISRRVAVLDFDPLTGLLQTGAAYTPPEGDKKFGRYEAAVDRIPDSGVWPPAVLQVNAFATVWKTMHLFEEQSALGRSLTWAFNSPQLFVVPRAGQMENAYYERESHSLQFFYFSSPEDPNKLVYTSLSRDIVAHETAHAVLDGIAPDLYNNSSPQSLALHEGVADLTALFMAFESASLTDFVLRQTNGSINQSSDFSSIAPQFGQALDPRAGALRDLFNRKTLDPADDSLDANGQPNFIGGVEPHGLCQVLTGAVYAVLVQLHERLSKRYVDHDRLPALAAAGKALGVGAQRLRRMLFRGLDYLPPGEVSFADFARAVIAADQAAYPDQADERGLIVDEFTRRKLVPAAADLAVETNVDSSAVQSLDLQRLVDSDWAAYAFANANRALLHVPDGVEYFRVRPRRLVTKMYAHRDLGQVPVQECLFQVSWDALENNDLGSSFPTKRQITAGTTLAIDYQTHLIRACLTSAPAEHQPDRDRFLGQLAGSGVLVPDRLAHGPDGRLRPSVLRAEISDGLMRARGTARALHITTQEV